MGFKSPLLTFGTDVWTGKPYSFFSRKPVYALTCCALLVVVMAAERLSFKVMLDRMQSYRYFLCQMMTFLYIPPLFCIVGYKAAQDEFIEEEVNGFPKLSFFVMGMLDLLHAMLLFIPGGKTSSPLTVLLMQGSLPFFALFSHILLGSRYKPLQVVGLFAVAGGLVLAIVPSFQDLSSEIFVQKEHAWNTIFYLLAAIPGSLSMMYKERSIRDRPMDMVYLNAWVSVYQFIGGLILAPVVFDLEILHLNQKLDGLECLINGRNEVATDHCKHGIVVLLVYVFCNVSMNFLILQVIKQTSVNAMYACTLLGFMLSFAALEVYDMEASAVHVIDAQAPWILHISSFVAVFCGKLLYHWWDDPEVTASTASAEDREAAALLDEEDCYGLKYS